MSVSFESFLPILGIDSEILPPTRMMGFINNAFISSLANPPDYEYLLGLLPEADGSEDVWPGLRHRLQRSSQMPIRTPLASMSQCDTQALILETFRDTICVRVGLHEECLRLCVARANQ